MTNLKKLRAIKLIILAFFFLTSCAQVDYKGIYTDKSARTEFEKKLPILIVGQELITNPTTYKYIEIAKAKNPSLRLFLILKRDLSAVERDVFMSHLNYFNGIVLFSPIDLSFLKKQIHDMPIINASIYDMENDNRYQEDSTIVYAPFSEENSRFIFLPVTEKIHIPSERPELYKYYLEDPFLTILKVRKEERRKSNFELILFTNNEGIERVKESAHESLKYFYVNDSTDRRIFFENRYIEICEWFFKATEDCFIEESDSPLHQKRLKILSEDSSKTHATFLGEEIKI